MVVLKNMTQNKKLNFNRPILSVRRKHSTMMMMSSQNVVDERKTDNAAAAIPRLPPHRQEQKSGPVKNPGTVPFHWEQAPGKPKIPPYYASHTLPPSLCENFEKFAEAKEESQNTVYDSSGYCDEPLFVDAVSRTRVDGDSGSFSSERKTRVFPDTLECASKKKPAAFRGIVKRDEECDQRGDLLAVCGLVPRFCFKSSICALNPVPAISVRTRAILSSCNGIQSSACSSTHTENEVKRKDNKIRSKNEITVIYCGKSLSFLEEKKVLGVKGFESQKKGSKTFQELLQADNEGSPNVFDLGGSNIVEKTVYVDSEYKVDNIRPRHSAYILDSVNEEEEEEEEEDNEIISTKRMDQMHGVYSSCKDFKKLVSSNDKLIRQRGAGTPKVFGDQNEDTILVSTKNIKVAENEATKNIEKQLTLTTLGKYPDVLVPPPLPKSPSDSWLGRTLPSMSTRNNGSFKAPKSTKVQRHNLRYPEDLLTTIQET